MKHSAWWWPSYTEQAVTPVPSVGHLVPNEAPEQIAEIVEHKDEVEAMGDESAP
jgi:hypothetical protein